MKFSIEEYRLAVLSRPSQFQLAVYTFSVIHSAGLGDHRTGSDVDAG